MKTFKSLFNLFLLAAGVILFSEQPAHAYLDAGTGSMITQLLLAGTAGLAVLRKVLWQRLLEFLRIEK